MGGISPHRFKSPIYLTEVKGYSSIIQLWDKLEFLVGIGVSKKVENICKTRDMQKL